MKLHLPALNDPRPFEAKGIDIPRYDVQAVRAQSAKAPEWIHFGPGNLFRGYIAQLSHDLMNLGDEGAGVVVVNPRGELEMNLVMEPYDLLSLQVVMPANGPRRYQVTGSISAAYAFEQDAHVKAVEQVFEAPSLQMLSFTITEKGYGITGMDGQPSPDFLEDVAQGPVWPMKNSMAMVAYFLYRRFEAGRFPLTLVSMDNFSHNGDKLKASVVAVIKAWVDGQKAPQAFLDWASDESQVAYPISVIDRITPRAGEDVAQDIKALGFEGVDRVVTDFGAIFAPYVNTESASYLVIEDRFTNGRPALEKVGVYFTDRETADRFERMKVCTCLNPLHTALAVSGCVLGFDFIADEMEDKELKALAEAVAKEGLPVVVDPGIVKPEAFLKEVLEERFPNKALPDTPQRIATDTSQKLAIRFGETIKAYQAREDLDPMDLQAIPLAIATWCRYLLGVDDSGQAFACSPDPLLEELQKLLAKVQWNKPDTGREALKPILQNSQIFGLDLDEAGLAEKIETFFLAMLQGEGAVRKLYQSVFS